MDSVGLFPQHYVVKLYHLSIYTKGYLDLNRINLLIDVKYR